MYSLECAAQTYTWGRTGNLSFVAKFLQNVQDTQPYAELWMGSHPVLPSKIHGKSITQTFSSIPFLFKILSIAKPLSIQVHPNKLQAHQLHLDNSTAFPDNNHKPEICIALTSMSVLCDFKPYQQIHEFLTSSTSFLTLVPYASDLKSLLRHLYDHPNEYTLKLRDYLDTHPADSLAQYLQQHFPDDLGIIVALLMNYIELSPGQSVVIHPGTCHCYLQGDCIEAMACSDNVIRAGLTPKAKDIDTLLKIMKDSSGGPNVNWGIETQPGYFEYLTGYDEFEVVRLEVKEMTVEINKPAPVIMCVMNGSALGRFKYGNMEMVEGNVYVSDCSVSISGNAVIYACYSNNANR